jgi:hypothetical protein
VSDASVAAFAVLASNLGGLVVGPVLVGALSDALNRGDPVLSLRQALLLFSLVPLAGAVHFMLSCRLLRKSGNR